MRSVVLSNSVLVVTAPPDGASALDFTDDAVVIRDQVNEVIELVPVVPKLHKLETLLRGREYDEGQEDIEEDVADPSVGPSLFSTCGFCSPLYEGQKIIVPGCTRADPS